MKNKAAAFYETLRSLTHSIVYTSGQSAELDLPAGIEAAADWIVERTGARGKLMFVGNGASAAISSHMATDFWKAGRMRAMAFNDIAGLTCIGQRLRLSPPLRETRGDVRGPGRHPGVHQLQRALRKRAAGRACGPRRRGGRADPHRVQAGQPPCAPWATATSSCPWKPTDPWKCCSTTPSATACWIPSSPAGARRKPKHWNSLKSRGGQPPRTPPPGGVPPPGSRQRLRVLIG